MNFQLRSSPSLKKLLSPLLRQSHPPCNPMPCRHWLEAGAWSRLPDLSPSGKGQLCRLKTLKEQVPHRKSSSVKSLGIRPVKTRPMQIIPAACVQSKIAPVVRGDTSRLATTSLRIILSESRMIPSRATAKRSCNLSKVSPFLLGTTRERCDSSKSSKSKCGKRSCSEGIGGCLNGAAPKNSLMPVSSLILRLLFLTFPLSRNLWTTGVIVWIHRYQGLLYMASGDGSRLAIFAASSLDWFTP